MIVNLQEREVLRDLVFGIFDEHKMVEIHDNELIIILINIGFYPIAFAKCEYIFTLAGEKIKPPELSRNGKER